jgi:hypothetical protein
MKEKIKFTASELKEAQWYLKNVEFILNPAPTKSEIKKMALKFRKIKEEQNF